MRHIERHRSMSYVLVPLGICILFIGVFGVVRLRASFLSMEYGISELEQRKLDTMREAKALLAERASLLSIHAVEKTAAADLGLTFQNRTKVVYVRPGDTGPSRASLGNRPAGAPDAPGLLADSRVRGGSL